MRLIRYAVAVLTVTCILLAAVVVPAAAAERQVTLTIQTVVSNPSSSPATVKLSIPLISSSSSPYQSLLSESFTPQPVKIEENGDTRTAHFEVRVPAGQSVTIEERYVLALKPYQRPEAGQYSLSEAERAFYLKGEPTIEADHPTLRKVSAQVTEGAATVEEKAQAVFRYVRGKLRYNASSTAANKGALAAYEAGSGVCQEFASLFVALMRASGVPARVVNGYVLLDSQRRLTTQGFAQRVRHQWAEYFDPAYGWVPVDPTFESTPDASLSRPAYVRQNFGDRPVKGTSAGAKVSLSRIASVTELTVEAALQN